MSFNLNTQTQNLLVSCLRQAFSSNTDYMYIEGIDGKPDEENTQIAIYRKFPKVLTGYPVIAVPPPQIPSIIRTMGNNIMSSTFGDVGGGLQGLCGETYGGPSEQNFVIEIYAETESQRDLIADYCINYLNFSQRHILEDLGLEVLEVSKQGENIRPFGNNYIYTTNVDVTIFAEWSETVNYTGNILTEVGFCNISIYGDVSGLSHI